MQWEGEGKHGQRDARQKNVNNKIQWLQTSPLSGNVTGLFTKSLKIEPEDN